MDTYLIPVAGLLVQEEWTLGPVVMRPAGTAVEEIRERLSDMPGLDRFRQAVEEQRVGAFGEVEATDEDDAIECVVQAVDVLRVFQHARYGNVQMGTFGLPGELGRGVIPYAWFGETAGHGGTFRGKFVGWTAAYPADWHDADAFQWVARGIGDPTPSEALRRALIGVELLARAIVEQRPALKMVEIVTALEALLLPHGTEHQRQTYRLARHVAYFGCGRPFDNLCGRDRDTCPYLGLDPASEQDRKALKGLRTRGNQDARWRCGEWHRVVDWYDVRSEVVHGKGPMITADMASSAAYWVLKILVEPILEWLSHHPDDPIEQLEAELRSLPPMPDWESVIGT